MQNKKIYICIICIVVVIVAIFYIKKNKNKEENTIEYEKILQVQTMEDGTKLNTSKKLEEAKIVDNIEISQVKLTYRNEKTNFIANVKNIGNTKINMIEVEIILLDIKGNTIETLDGLIGTINVGETGELNASITGDYTDINDYRIIIK